MPKKIKRKVTFHDCNKYLRVVTKIFLGLEHHPLAITDESKFESKWGMLVQCSFCKNIFTIPIIEKDKINAKTTDQKTEDTK